MANIGIIGALEVETEKILEKLENREVKQVRNMKFYTGEYENNLVTVGVSGVGKVSAALCTQYMIDNYEIDCIIQIGVAGKINESVNIGSIIGVLESMYYDVDVTTLGFPYGYLPLQKSKFQSDTKLLMQLEEFGEKHLTKEKFFIGRVISGDQFANKSKVRNDFIKDFDPICMDMMATSVGQACYLNDIPFVSILIISNKADDRAAINNYMSVDTLTANLGDFLAQFISHLKL